MRRFSSHSCFLVMTYSFVFMLIGFSSCMPEANETEPQLDWNLESEIFRKIYDLQVGFKVDSLEVYISHEQPSIRYAVAKAFASIKDSSHTHLVFPLLMDSVSEVAAMAAYSIGQMGSSKAESPLIDAFRAGDTSGKYNLLNSRILEAIGKCGSETSLNLLSTIQTYLPTDTLLLEGQCRGLYQFALRRMTTEEGTATMVNYLTSRGFPYSVRLIAANYLARAVEIDLSTFAYSISRMMESDRDPYIRMALALAAPKTRSERARQLLSTMALEDSDYRVRVNAIRGLELMRAENLNEILLEGMFDAHPSVSNAAASALIRNLDEHTASFLHEQENISRMNFRTKSAVLASALRNMPFYYTVSANNLSNRLKRLYASASNNFEKEAWIFALSHDPLNLDFILNELTNSEDHYLSTNSLLHLENLLNISRQKPASNFNRTVVLRKIAEALSAAFSSGDAGKVAVAADIVKRNLELLSPYFRDPAFFEEIMQKISIPAETETYNQLVFLFNELFDRELEFHLPEKTNPIDWELYLRLPDTVRISIQLNTGEVKIAMAKEEHPGTIANFISLILDGYYDGKIIHRVVPNFVIQGGCPRGDGYGSADYTIRSELPPVYFDREGLIGMASAGNHTESLQWFITHSPTMHLDGRYTLFGEVYSGMEVVHLSMAGNKIERIQLLNE